MLEDIASELSAAANRIEVEKAGAPRLSFALVAGLTIRQQEVLRAMARGLQNKQIARALKISFKTVEVHRSILLQRLNVQTSAEAIRIAFEAGL